MNLPPREGCSTSPKKPSELHLLRTSHDIQKAYAHRQNTVATPAGVYTFQEGASLSTRATSRTSSQDVRQPPLLQSSHHFHVPSPEPGWSSSFSDPYLPPSPKIVVKASRSQKQWIKWTTIVIPSLVRPYLYLMRVTDSLQNLYHNQKIICTCGLILFLCSSAHLKLSALKDHTIITCQCSTAPHVLLVLG